jgi:hypothetical protein
MTGLIEPQSVSAGLDFDKKGTFRLAFMGTNEAGEFVEFAYQTFAEIVEQHCTSATTAFAPGTTVDDLEDGSAFVLDIPLNERDRSELLRYADALEDVAAKFRRFAGEKP